MQRIGLTGPIACGKSTVAQFFARLGYQIISADKVAKTLTAPHQPAWQRIVTHFGPQILTPNAELDRAQLRRLIAQHPEHKQWLEALLHPLIRRHMGEQIQQRADSPLLIEIPLLKNRDDYPSLTHVIAVLCDEKTQIARLMQRDACSYAEAKQLIDIQIPHATYRNIADEVMVNEGCLEDLEAAIKRTVNR